MVVGCCDVSGVVMCFVYVVVGFDVCIVCFCDLNFLFEFMKFDIIYVYNVVNLIVLCWVVEYGVIMMV